MAGGRRRDVPFDGVHRVRVGDSVASVAYEYGHYWGTIWAHPKNDELREKRGNPNILHEGDELFIPPFEYESFDCQTGKRHTFRRRGVPSVLRVRLYEPAPKEIHTLEWLFAQERAEDGSAKKPELEPWAGVDYVVTVNGVETRGQTDADGIVSVNIEPDAPSATLVVAPETDKERTIPLHVGHIHPIDTMAGVRERLNNLGFTCESTAARDADPALADAVARFQQAFELKVTGELDEKTARKLLDVYGS